MKTLFRTLLTLALTVLLTGSAFSQGAQSGAISGTITDPTGAVVSKATITVVNDATKSVERTAESGSDGLFSVTLLPPGSYTVNIKAAGFKSYSEKVDVLLNQTSRLEAKLQVGTANETIEVTANAVTVNTESAVTGQPVDAATLRALPLPVPNFLMLLSLSPGTAGEMPDVRNANRGIVDINVNGQRTSNNSVTLEGINVNDFNLAHFDTVPLPNQHTIQQFDVATSLYDASSGIKGGGAVGLVFKTGTNQWHGEAYWQHRNDWLNANEWFNNFNGVPRQKFLQNVLGFSGSGPVPLVGGNWFANVQGLRARNGVNPTGSVATVTSPNFPTNADGTTSAALVGAFAGVSPASVDPTALNILNLKNSAFGGTFLIPRLSQPGCKLLPASTNMRCITSKVTPDQDTQYSTVYDRSIFGGKGKVSGRWFYDNFNAQLPFGTASTLAFPEAQVQNNRFSTISYTHQISSRQLNVFRFGFSRFISSFVPTDLVNLSDISASRPNSSAVPGVYQAVVTGAFSFGTGVNDDRGTVSNTFDYNDTWTLAMGKHTFKAGGGATRYQLNRFNRFASRGSLSFSSFAHFVSGTIDSVQAATGDPQRYFRATDFGAFFEDDYKIRSDLTLNLGLRWDSFEFSHDLFERTTVFDPSLVPNKNPFLFASDINLPGLTGTPGVGSCGARTCRTSGNFGPRVGFAWQPFHDQKTVVRGGYGIYYQRLSNQNFLQGSLGPPFFVQLALNTPGTTLANPLPGGPTSGAVDSTRIPQNSHFAGVGVPGAGGTGIINGDPNNPLNFPLFKNDAGQYCSGFAPTGTPVLSQATNCSISLASFSTVPADAKTPYNQQWNFGVQRELGKSWTVEVDYVGSHYIHGLGIFVPWLASVVGPSNPIHLTDSNGVNYTINTNTVLNEPLRVSALGLSRRQGARQDGNVGFAIYHSAQFSLSHRFQKGLYFQSSYTWSKEIDNVSGSQSTDELNATQPGQLGAAVVNFGNLNPALNRSIGDFDRRHRVVLSYIYDLPIPKNGIWGSQAFQGWSISGINTYQNGLPFSVTDGNGGRGFGGGTSTGLLTCGSISSAYNPGSVQSQIVNGVPYLNPTCFTSAAMLPNSACVIAGVATAPCPATQLANTTAPTGYGSVPRNAFRGPFQQNWDLGLNKHFKILERHQLDFRVDAFNVLNHPSFRQPSFVGITAPATFGTINSTVNPARLIQLGVQYSF